MVNSALHHTTQSDTSLILQIQYFFAEDRTISGNFKSAE